MLYLRQFGVGLGSEFVLCVGQFGVGLGRECVLCVGEFGVGLGEGVCAVFGIVFCGFE